MPTSRTPDYWLLWFVALLSLAINVWVVRALVGARRQVAESAATLARVVGDARASAIDYSVRVEWSVPISVTVPVSTTVSVPISVTLPISTQVTVPLRTPFGDLPLTFPVQAAVPVNVRPTVPIRADVPISITVPVALDVPVHIVLAETSLGPSLSQAQDYLQGLSAQLGAAPQSSATPTPPR